MHILLLVKDFAEGTEFNKDGLPTKSGAEFHAENHALQLIKIGHKVTIMTRKRHFFVKSREIYQGIDLVRLHEPFRGLELIIRLFTTHRNIDAVYIIGKPKFVVWAILWAKIFGKNNVLSLTGKAELFNSVDNWRTRILTKCKHYIALSQEIKRGFINQGQIKEDKIVVLGQGIDTNKYKPPTVEEKIRFRNEYGIEKDALILLFCARLVPDKGIDTLKKVWEKIYTLYPNSQLIVVGGGRNDIVTDLKKLSKTLDNSIILTGEVNNTRKYYCLGDVNIFPSHHEGLPTSLMEAMSCGLPSVVSDIGGCEDLVENKVSGLRVPVDDVQGFIDGIRYLFDNKDKRHLWGNVASKFIKNNCDYEVVIKKLENIISENKNEG